MAHALRNYVGVSNCIREIHTMNPTAFPMFSISSTRIRNRLHTPMPPEVEPDPAPPPDDDPDPDPGSPPIPGREPDRAPPSQEPPAGDPPERAPPMHAGAVTRGSRGRHAPRLARQSWESSSATARSTSFLVHGRLFQSSSVTRLELARSSAKICV